MIALLVAAGAAVGAPLRYLTDRGLQSRRRTAFPLGTFAVNVLGSFVLGLVAGAGDHLSAGMVALIGTGFCGALSTFSTFSYETLRLAQRRELALAAGYVLASVAAGLAAATLGFVITR